MEPCSEGILAVQGYLEFRPKRRSWKGVVDLVFDTDVVWIGRSVLAADGEWTEMGGMMMSVLARMECIRAGETRDCQFRC